MLAPPKSRGIGRFSFGLLSSYTINGGTISVSGDKGAEDKKEDTSYTPDASFYFGVLAYMIPTVTASAGAATAASRFSFGASHFLVRDVAA